MSSPPPNDPRFPPPDAPQPGQFAPPPPAPYGNTQHIPPPYPAYGQPEQGGQFAPPSGVPPYVPPYAPPGAYPPGAYGQGASGQVPYGSPQYGYTPSYNPAPPEDRRTIGPERVPWRWYDLLIAGGFFIIIAAFSFANSGTTSDASTQDTVRRSGVSRDAFLILNLVSSAVIYGLVLLLIWWRTVRAYHVPWSALGVRRAPLWQFALMIPVYLGMAIVAGGLGNLINQLFFGGSGRNPQIDSITGGGGFSWVALICAVLSASVIAPVVEELFFRGMLYGWLRSRLGGAGGIVGIVGAVVLDGFIFATVHGIGLILASIFVVGVTLALVYERTKSTLVTITLHVLFNSVTVATVFYLLATGQKIT